MSAADQLFTPLRAATTKTLIGLLAVTGMRIGETVRLTVADVDLDRGVVLIANAKFGRQRLVRLDPSSCQAIAGYLRLPARRHLGTAPERPCSSRERDRGERAHRPRGIAPDVGHARPAGAGRRPPAPARLSSYVRHPTRSMPTGPAVIPPEHDVAVGLARTLQPGRHLLVPAGSPGDRRCRGATGRT